MTSGALSLLSRYLSPENRSLIPFLPRSTKLFIFLIFLLNIRSWPGVWHVRVFASIIQLRLKKLLYGQRNKELFWKTASPVGRTLLPSTDGKDKGVQIVSTFWAAPDDCDWNGHMSNSSYAKNLDPVRMRVCAEWFPALFADGGWIGLAGAHYHFIREIPVGARYEVRLTVGGWEKKWAYLVAKFVTYPTKTKSKSHTSTKSNTIPAPGLRTHDDDGALIHCIAVSTLCAKHGRVTIPPNVAFAMSGFSLTEPGSDENWQKANSIRAQGPKAVQAFLRGGWNGVPRDEVWWEPSEEVERERKRRVELLDLLGRSMDGLRM
ncbi:hypothetical protein FRC12_024048 [Ceratobasidium sp. 428]|nr:hypothetical protein FRC12_024048 [Ceratobasidium sp. 428]